MMQHSMLMTKVTVLAKTNDKIMYPFNGKNQRRVKATSPGHLTLEDVIKNNEKIHSATTLGQSHADVPPEVQQ